MNVEVWLAEARAKNAISNGEPDLNFETNIARGEREIRIIDNLPPTGPLNTLLVGLGLGVKDIECPFAPYTIAAHLGWRDNNDYKLTLVDKEPRVIADISGRARLYVTENSLVNHPELLEAWKKYLSEAGVKEEIIHERAQEPDLRFLDWMEEISTDFPSPESYLVEGIHTADIPPMFREKMAIGDIRLLLGDIATVNLPAEKYDFASCRNVLYLLNPWAQRLAVANLVASVKEGGIVLVNDVGSYSGTRLFKRPSFQSVFGSNRNDGWLDEKTADMLGVKIKEFPTEIDSINFLLCKKASTFCL